MHTALDLIGASIGRSSPVSRTNRELIRNNLLALDEVGLTLFEVCLLGCEVDELIVSLVGEAGLVVAAIGDPQVKEGVRVVVVRAPTGDGHDIVAGLTVLRTLLGNHGVNGNLDAENLSPLLLIEGSFCNSRSGVAAVDGEVSGEIVYRAAKLRESRCKVFLSLFLITGRRIQLCRPYLQRGCRQQRKHRAP